MQVEHKKRRLWLALGIVLSLAIGVVVVALWLDNLKVGAPKTDQISSTAQVEVQPEKPKTIQVSLPNASPINALKEDYNSDASLWRVVSKDYPLTDSHYTPANLQFATVASRSDKSNEERSLRADIMPDVEKLFAAMKERGYDMLIGSGYRSYNLQNMYFTNYARAKGEAEANKYSARPGQSEHQTGLVVDIAYTSMQCYLDSCFADTPAGQWIAAHAHEYGFIVRYPKDKTEITKYIYEPWHLRYVGKDLATVLHQTGLTLDEARPYLQTALEELKQAKAL